MLIEDREEGRRKRRRKRPTNPGAAKLMLSVALTFDYTIVNCGLRRQELEKIEGNGGNK